MSRRRFLTGVARPPAAYSERPPTARGITAAAVALAVTVAAAGCGSNEPGSPVATSAATAAASASPTSPEPSSPTAVSVTGSQASGRLVWGQFGDAGVTLYTADADGTDQKPLLPPGTYSEQPHWSPDGSKVAVLATDHDMAVGAVVNADGTGYRAFQHPSGAPNLACVLWSPDAALLACEGFDVAGLDGVYTVRATDGTGLRRLTTTRDVPCAWSPDGSQMLISRISAGDADNRHALMVMNADGTGAQQLTDDVGCGDWSADGRRVVAVGDGELVLLTLDGARSTIPVDGVVTSAAFSPNGSNLVLSVHPGDHHTDLFTMQVDGSHRVQITTTPDDEEFGDWAP